MSVSTAGVRVLIVDDQAAFRDAVRLVVDVTDGFEVVGEASSGEVALAMVEDLAPGLVLMDIKLPGIDGIEATRRIATAHPEVRVLVLSTYEEYASRALGAGATAFTLKSAFGPDVIVAAWKSAC